MALVVPPPTALPNALQPTTEAVQRDANKREITPAINPDGSAASVNDSTVDKKYPKKGRKSTKKPPHKQQDNQSSSQQNNTEKRTEKSIDQRPDNPLDSSQFRHFQQSLTSLLPDPDTAPEDIVNQMTALRQSLLARTPLTDEERWQLAEINHISRVALNELARQKCLAEVKMTSAAQPFDRAVIKDEDRPADLMKVELEELFFSSIPVSDKGEGSDKASVSDKDPNKVSAALFAKSKLAGAVVGQFYEDSTEPEIEARIDHQE